MSLPNEQAKAELARAEERIEQYLKDLDEEGARSDLGELCEEAVAGRLSI